ncbi:MAG: hypothetical protein GY861_01390 [bacterium]|nr:hypothetical protein [bacterium]
MLSRITKALVSHPMPDSGEEFRMQFQISVDDIRYFKDQQWKVAYYTFLLLGLMLALSDIIADADNKLTGSEQDFMTAFAAIITTLGVLIICWLEYSLHTARITKDKMLKRFSKSFKKEIHPENPSCFTQFGLVPLFISIMLIGLFLTILTIVKAF